MPNTETPDAPRNTEEQLVGGGKMKRETFTAWVTKYALTTGIEKVNAEWCADISESMIVYGNVYGRRLLTAHGKDWHRTPEEAIARAKEMRDAKIAAMQKQIAKLERMVFVVPNATLRCSPEEQRKETL